jgi:hypothetical protein
VEFFSNTIPVQERIAQDGIREVGLIIENKIQPISFLSAEALIAFKLLFFRGKDRSDILTLVKHASIDLDYVTTLVNILQSNNRHHDDDGHLSGYDWWNIVVEEYKAANKKT